jgi:DNA-binding IclR family transcriptional regulator
MRSVSIPRRSREALCALQLPVFYLDGYIVAAISLTVPAFINEDRGINKEIDAVKRCSSAIANLSRKKRFSRD